MYVTYNDVVIPVPEITGGLAVPDVCPLTQPPSILTLGELRTYITPLPREPDLYSNEGPVASPDNG
jgi:hypothetical protein